MLKVENYYLPAHIVNVATVQNPEHDFVVEDMEEPDERTKSYQEHREQEICERIKLDIDELTSEPLLLRLLAFGVLTHL